MSKNLGGSGRTQPVDPSSGIFVMHKTDLARDTKLDRYVAIKVLP